jgi:hypothetical protein
VSGTWPLKLDVESGAGKVELWNMPTGGAKLSSHLQFESPEDVPSVLWVAPVDSSDGERDIVLNLSWTAGAVTFEDIVKITVVEVESVEWMTLQGQALPPNDHPTGTVGLKWCPGATEPEGAWNDKVFVQATIKPPIPWQPLYFAVFEPGDRAGAQ